MKPKKIIFIAVTSLALMIGLPIDFASAESNNDLEREDMSVTYLQILPDESIESLFDWCTAHKGEPVSSNPVIDVPNYVSCDEVLLISLSREAKEMPKNQSCEEAQAKVPDFDLNCQSTKEDK